MSTAQITFTCFWPLYTWKCTAYTLSVWHFLLHVMFVRFIFLLQEVTLIHPPCYVQRGSWVVGRLFYLPPREYLAIPGEIFGCHNLKGHRVLLALVDKGQACHWTPYSIQDHPHREAYAAPNANTAKAEKAWYMKSLGGHLVLLWTWQQRTLSYVSFTHFCWLTTWHGNCRVPGQAYAQLEWILPVFHSWTSSHAHQQYKCVQVTPHLHQYEVFLPFYH